MPLDFTGGKLIASVVERIVGMPLDLDPFNAVLLRKNQDFFPEVLVFNWLFIALDPVSFHPIVEPMLPEGIYKICAVGINLHFASFFETGKRLDWRHQLHAVVGGMRFISG